MDSKEAISKFKENIEDNSHYIMSGDMEITSNEELYKYSVNVSYLEGDYYKASLTNKDTNYEQIILKNESGVYVITPSLNKSFKYQSEWPFNSSQAYILASLLTDLENDSNVVFEEKEDSYILQSTVNYPNNSSLTSQKITFDKEMEPRLVEVFNKEGIANIVFKVATIDYDTSVSKEDFDISTTTCNDCSSSEVSDLEETVYPMYLPVGTKFKGEETISTDNSKRVILTFDGDKSFTLIEEVSLLPSEFEITSTSGELVFYENVLGNLTESSLNWSMNGKDYYLISEDLSNEELLKVAASTSVVSVTK
ncbi:MAG: outer membrane lipoprotein carrier protein LolA [Bacilli bacterium]